jgi:N utilization substance protein B
MGRRTKARECAFQILYQREITREEMPQVIQAFWLVRSGTPQMRGMAERLALGADSRAADLDRAIVAAASNWRLDRMAAVDRTILRLGAYELVAEPKTPPAVVLDEAIELAKRFGEADSPAFVNGVLDAIRQRLPASGTRAGLVKGDEGR